MSSQRERVAEKIFWLKVKKKSGNDCWEWTGTMQGPRRMQYGCFEQSKIIMGSRTAHRYSWFLKHGPIPNGLCVCHKCDNPKCVRPSHLFLGTKAENTWDAKAKGRVRGNGISKRKLSAADIIFISQSNMKQHELAARFNIHPEYVGLIRRNQVRRDVAR